MKKNIIIKSLLNGVVGFFLVAVILGLVKGIPFGQALAEPYSIVLGISAILGSFIGFSREAMKQ